MIVAGILSIASSIISFLSSSDIELRYSLILFLIVRKKDKLEDAKSLKDFSNKKVLGQLNTLYDTVIDQIPGVKHVTALEDYPAMVMQLNSELVDAVTAELPVAAGIVATKNISIYMVVIIQAVLFMILLNNCSLSSILIALIAPILLVMSL